MNNPTPEQDKHSWKKVPVPEKLKDTFSTKWICTNGDCHCEKLHSIHKDKGVVYHLFQYTRDKQMYSKVPRCYGKVPLNEQTIND